MPLSAEVVTANREALACLVSLNVSFAPDEEPWFTIDGIEAPGRSAVTAPGARSCCCRRRMCSFEAFVELVVARPYWFDILKLSGGGDLAEMRRAAESLLYDEEEINEAREEIRNSLNLDEADDPIGALYVAIAAPDAIARATNGSPSTTLFNRFSIDNNPMLRDAAA